MKICLSWGGYNVTICLLSQGTRFSKQNVSVLGVLLHAEVSVPGGPQAKYVCPGVEQQRV